jgi:pimeloyl-ACP methyl ester carboxylesterase
VVRVRQHIGRRAGWRVALLAAIAGLGLGWLPPVATGVALPVVRPLPAVGSLARATPVIRWVSHVLTAGGVRQWIACGGTGTVTVVVIPGLHADHVMWQRALPGMAAITRTCIYDRPGLGASPPRSPHATVDAGRQADELAALLVAAHISTPLVLVGHSYGGLVARAFAARHRARVAGAVLVEGVAPYDRLSHYWHEGGDRIDLTRSSAAAARMPRSAMPLVVEAAQDPDRSYWGGPAYGASASDIADWRAHQKAAASLSSDSSYVIVRHSAHVIEHDQPAAVVAGVRLVVRAVTHHAHMPRCALGAYGVQPLCA